MNNRKYGWYRQHKDDRDLRYSVARPIAGLPRKSDLSHQLPECWDQGATSSCIAHGTSAAIWNGEVVAGRVPVMPSRLFNYWNFRELEGDTDHDDGGQIRDGIKAANLYGVPPESIWPFDTNKLYDKPSPFVYEQAAPGKIHFYASVDLRNIDQIKLALSHKLGVIFGFDVPNYFESDQMAETGIITLSDFNRIVGGHCVYIIGHDDDTEMVLVRNSWGTSWGPFNGNFKMSYDMITSHHCSDGWVIRLK